MDMMRRSAGNTSNGEFTITFPNGPIKFQSDEGVLYSRLFHIVRSITVDPYHRLCFVCVCGS